MKDVPGYYEKCYTERQLIVAYASQNLSLSRVKPFVVTRYSQHHEGISVLAFILAHIDLLDPSIILFGSGERIYILVCDKLELEFNVVDLSIVSRAAIASENESFRETWNGVKIATVMQSARMHSLGESSLERFWATSRTLPNTWTFLQPPRSSVSNRGANKCVRAPGDATFTLKQPKNILL